MTTRPATVEALVLGLVVMVAALLVNTIDRGLSWDEAVYLAEVARGVEPVGFAAHRARGVSLLAGPVGAIAPLSAVALRIYLLVSTTAATVWAYARWRADVGSAAWVAVGLFATHWTALFYLPELSPNLWVAIFAVALARELSTPPGEASRPLLVALGLALVLFRPSDGSVLIAAMGAAHFARFRDLPTMAWLAAGAATGWAVWAAESIVRFGGIIDRLATAATMVESEPSSFFYEHLLLLDGPLIGPDPLRSVEPLAAIWVAGLLLLAIIGAVTARERTRYAAPIAGATALAATYLLGVGALAPRFLTPTYALLALPAGSAVMRLVEARRAGASVARVSLVLALLAGALWQGATARSLDAVETDNRANAAALAAVLRDRSRGEPCAFVSQYGFPQIQTASGCRGGRLHVDEATADLGALMDRTATGTRLYALSVRRLDEVPTGWSESPVDTPHGAEWFLYERP